MIILNKSNLVANLNANYFSIAKLVRSKREKFELECANFSGCCCCFCFSCSSGGCLGLLLAWSLRRRLKAGSDVIRSMQTSVKLRASSLASACTLEQLASGNWRAAGTGRPELRGRRSEEAEQSVAFVARRRALFWAANP